jgi:two-component system, NarL family, sensor histidine kinase UhpB
VIISFLTLFFGIHSVVRPLQAVGVQARRIGAGDFGAAAESVGGVQEIENLRQILDQMAHQLRQHHAALRDYVHAVTQAQEEERSRLSRELHDETVQTLIAMGHKAQRVQRSLERDPTQTAGYVDELRQMIAGAVEEVRRFSKALRPLYLEELGLIPALEMLARDSGASFQVNGPQQRLKAEQELVLYRIAQEALHNALRHARATNTQVDFQFSQIEVKLRVSDNGVGFETPACFTRLTQTGHFGLMGMHERAQLVNGRLNVSSSPGSGTTVVFTVAA